MFAGPDRPTAIIASDSIIGLEIYKALRDLSLSVPRDVSLIGAGARIKFQQIQPM